MYRSVRNLIKTPGSLFFAQSNKHYCTHFKLPLPLLTRKNLKIQFGIDLFFDPIQKLKTKKNKKMT